jgi:hypothetical protein
LEGDEWEERRATTIRVSKKLWHEVKLEALKQEMTAGEIVEEALRLWLKENKVAQKEK